MKKMKSRFKLRDILIFLAGAEFFHTLSHVVLLLLITFPWQTKWVLVTRSLNQWAIIINAIITVVLLVWASKTKKK